VPCKGGSMQAIKTSPPVTDTGCFPEVVSTARHHIGVGGEGDGCSRGARAAVGPRAGRGPGGARRGADCARPHGARQPPSLKAPPKSALCFKAKKMKIKDLPSIPASDVIPIYFTSLIFFNSNLQFLKGVSCPSRRPQTRQMSKMKKPKKVTTEHKHTLC